MRIQHNIMAMNAYRNYNTNTKALSGNLEKLSSGYKINRAGDDAAGLAISEKMRAQITGLDAAQKNVKDGISLVKTAEGAMQEIQDMLNRMDYLATQSANGTYQNEVDRENLQKEVNNLKTEINRIADSANFNGIKLLDGSLDDGSSGSAASGAGKTTLVEVTGGKHVKGAMDDGVPAAQENTSTFSQSLAGGTTPFTELSDGEKIDFTMKLTDGTTINRTLVWDKTKGNFMDASDSSKTYATGASANATSLTAAQLATTAKNILTDEDFADTKEFAKRFNVTANSATVKLTAEDDAFDTPTIESMVFQSQTNSAVRSGGDTAVIKEGKGDFETLDMAQLNVYDAAKNDLSTEDCIFEIGGYKFAFVADDKSMKDYGDDVTTVKADATSKKVTTTQVNEMVARINRKTGLAIAEVTGTATKVNLYSQGSTGSASGGAGKPLTLQIGDTSDSFNQMKVAVGDMHTKAMGKGKTTLDGVEKDVTKTIADIDIGTQEGAQEAVAVIKNAINYVSSIRGDLGAVQNRLDHTANNLSVMAENIQDAESTIRDTDVANEMMSYVKNNILVQSAQAMLAQANQVPQGVLQLLG